MNYAESLEEFEDILFELNQRDDDQVILVEGLKDRGALNLLGVYGEIWQVKGPDPIFHIGERLHWDGKRGIVLTDWDRTGGQIARRLIESMESNGVKYDIDLRRRLARVCRKDIKDIESLPAFYSNLVAEVQRSYGMLPPRREERAPRTSRNDVDDP